MKKHLQTRLNKINALRGTVAATAGLVAGTASAAVPTEVTDAISAGGADAVAVAIAFLVAGIGIAAVLMMWKGKR